MEWYFIILIILAIAISLWFIIPIIMTIFVLLLYLRIAIVRIFSKEKSLFYKYKLNNMFISMGTFSLNLWKKDKIKYELKYGKNKLKQKIIEAKKTIRILEKENKEILEELYKWN